MNVKAKLHFCLLQNITAIDDGPQKTQYFKRYCEAFTGQVIPFDVQLWYKPSERVAKLLGKFERNTIPGMFLHCETKISCR